MISLSRIGQNKALASFKDIRPRLSKGKRGLFFANSLRAKFMSQLSDTIYDQIQALCEKGDALAEKDQFAAALMQYWAAWDLLPEPRTEWQSATWILGAIGDANFLNDDFEAGRDNLSLAMHCPDAIGNPFLHLRLGQCQYELGNLDQAADELTRAYMGGGVEIFAEEGEYFEFLKTKLKAPSDGW